MGSPADNATLIGDLYHAFGRGDMAAVAAAYDDDVVQHVFHSATTLPTEHRGKASVFNGYAALIEGSTKTFWMRPETIVATDGLAVAIIRAGVQVHTLQHEWRGVEVFAIRNGKVTEFWTLPLDRTPNDEPGLE